MLCKGLDDPDSPWKDDLPVADPLLRRVQRLGPVYLDDVLVLIPLDRTPLSLVEIVEPNVTMVPCGELNRPGIAGGSIA
jgi:hypothetical protein